MIDKNSPIPIYYQLKELIKEEIRSNKYKSGTQISSESEISKKYNISRMTARHAIDRLVNEGVLYRIQGKGTFVAPERFRQDLAELTSFTQEMSRIGMRASSVILGLAVEDASPDIKEKLNHEKIIKIKRIRLCNNEPMGVETSYILYPEFKFILVEDMSTESLYALLTNKGGVKFSHAKQVMQASVADKEQARLLNVPPGTPILVDTRLTFMVDDMPIEYVEAFYRGDLYKYEVILMARNKPYLEGSLESE